MYRFGVVTTFRIAAAASHKLFTVVSRHRHQELRLASDSDVYRHDCSSAPACAKWYRSRGHRVRSRTVIVVSAVGDRSPEDTKLRFPHAPDGVVVLVGGADVADSSV